MTSPITKTEILEKLHGDRAVLEAVLNRIPSERMTQPGVENDWSVKDIMAHIVDWEQRMVQWLGKAFRGETPEMPAPGLTWDDLHELNERTYLENRDRPLEEVIVNFHESYRQALAAVENAPEAPLTETEYYEWMEGEALYELVAVNTYRHYRDHLEALKAWASGG